MPHKFNPEHSSKLEERRTILQPEEVLRELGLGPGDVMLDIGAGTGYFSIPASEIVGAAGRIIATDIAPQMKQKLEAMIREASVRNIETVLSEEHDPLVPAAVADFAFICTVLHEVEDKARFLTAVRKALKPGGRIAVVEWVKREMEKGPPFHDRIDEPQTAALLGRAGFSGVSARTYNDYFYFVTATN